MRVSIYIEYIHINLQGLCALCHVIPSIPFCILPRLMKQLHGSTANYDFLPPQRVRFLDEGTMATLSAKRSEALCPLGLLPTWRRGDASADATVPAWRRSQASQHLEVPAAQDSWSFDSSQKNSSGAGPWPRKSWTSWQANAESVHRCTSPRQWDKAMATDSARWAVYPVQGGSCGLEASWSLLACLSSKGHPAPLLRTTHPKPRPLRIKTCQNEQHNNTERGPTGVI